MKLQLPWAGVFLTAFLCAFDPAGGARLRAANLEPGTFQGVIRSDSNNDESFGFTTLTLTKSGTFTWNFNLGVNTLGPHSYVKTGRFNANGEWNFEGPAPVREPNYAIPRIISLRLAPGNNPQRITGDITDLTHSSTVELERVATIPSGVTAAATGNYTFWIGNQGASGLPPGTGFGTIAISKNGRAVVTGRTADNRHFSHTSSLTVGNRLPVFARLSPGMGGILAGWLAFKETSDSSFTGTFTWLGPEVAGPNHAFVNLYSGDVPVLGSRFISNPKGMALAASAGSFNLHLHLSGGGLEVPDDRMVTLLSNNKVVFNPREKGNSLSFAPSTGAFSGTFLHGTRVTTYRGIVLQKQNRGMGFFIDRAGESGQVTVQPF